MNMSQMADCLIDPKLHPPSGEDDQACVGNPDNVTNPVQFKPPFASIPFELDPVPPTVDDLVQRLAELGERSPTPSKERSSVLSRLDKSASKTFSRTRSLLDSGYASIASKPEDVEAETSQQSAGPSLRVFDRPIPDYLQHQFYDLKVLYAKDLLKAVYKKNVAQKDLSMKLKYLGTSASSAELYIVVQCEPRSAKKVKRFFARSDVQEFLGKFFKLHVIDKAPRGLASADNILVYGRRDSRSAGTMCGQPIMLSNGETCAFATIGGIVKVRKGSNERAQLYGLTAAHSLIPLLGRDHAEPDAPDDNASDSSEDEDDVDGNDNISIENLQEMVLDTEAQPFTIQEAGILGSVVANSVNRAANRDWGLVALSSRCLLPNLLHQHDALTGSREIPIYFSAADLPHSYRAGVTVLTCRGPQKGTLETNNSVLFSSPGADFIWTYDLKLDAGYALRPGDSGSWVIDSSGRVLGHISSIDAFGEAFVVPLAGTLDDIRESLGMSDVSLPSKDDIAKLRPITDTALPPAVAGTEDGPFNPAKCHIQNAMIRNYRDVHEHNACQHQQTPHNRSEPLEQQQADATQRQLRADSRTDVKDACSVPSLSVPPHARAQSGLTFTLVTDNDGVQHLALSGLEASPFRTFFSGTTWDGSTLPPDDELSFVPLLDQAAPSRFVHDPNLLTTRATARLMPVSFCDAMLLQHLREADLGDALGTLLVDVLSQRHSELYTALSFRDFAAYEREDYSNAAFEVYDVGVDGKVNKTSTDVVAADLAKYYPPSGLSEHLDEVLDAPLMWDAPLLWESIKDVNLDGSSVGRITIIQEPTLLMLAALHLAMSPHFDMSEILESFLFDASHQRTRACLDRAFEHLSSTGSSAAARAPESTPVQFPFRSFHTSANIRQRTFFFVFKYYTIVGEGLRPAPWQKYDDRTSKKRPSDHIDIAECGSVLALSLGGEPKKPLRMRPRREKARDGFLFDTFSSWHVLSIQSFPDDHHTVRREEFQQKNFCNGPYAFLELLTAEYRDAARRLMLLHEKITKLINPPIDFMFNRNLRDRLLFEDRHFSYIRRYFWAYNTLAVINTSVEAMIAAYTDSFTDEFWAGTHPFLWPHPDPHSPDGKAYREKMRTLRKELAKAVAKLGEVLTRNERTRKEIENLRDQLFSGTSIRESRKAIEHGENIRILTLATVVFLPATFVTSLFVLPRPITSLAEWSFPLTMVLVCLPLILLFFLQMPVLSRLLYGLWASVSGILTSLKRRSKKRAQPAAVPISWPEPQGRQRRRKSFEEEKRAAGRWMMGFKERGQTGSEESDLGGV